MKEEDLQIMVCKYLDLQYPDVFYTSDLSGIKLSIGSAVKAKKTRCKRNVIPDLLIFEPRKGYHGLILELKKDLTELFNKIHQVSHAITAREIVEAAGVYVVTARASLPDGRYTDSLGAVNISGLKGDAYGNAMMKAETKAKRRATLDLLGLGMMDETETETIPGAAPEPLPVIPIQASITDEINGIPKPYLMPQSDAQYICDLIEQATTTASLRSLMSTNVAFFQSNVEVKNRLLNKGMRLKKLETESQTN